MLFETTPAAEKRSNFRRTLSSDRLLRFPGAFSPLIAMMIEQIGFDGVYISGAVLSNNLGVPDVGLTTQSEVVNAGREIARVTSLPSIIDIDTGFGEPMNVARTIQLLEDAGVCGCHIEDQENPKRCGHLEGKSLVDVPTMTRKIKAASEAKRDENFLLIARTDARASEGLDKAIDRAKAYIDAGAEMIFPEALADEKEFEAFRRAVKVPLLANMTEFGKSKLLTADELQSLGYNIVIYPVTTLRLALRAVRDGLTQIKQEGHQKNVVEKMLTRAELYELVQYEKYNVFDKNIFNFSLRK